MPGRRAKSAPPSGRVPRDFGSHAINMPPVYRDPPSMRDRVSSTASAMAVSAVTGGAVALATGGAALPAAGWGAVGGFTAHTTEHALEPRIGRRLARVAGVAAGALSASSAHVTHGFRALTIHAAHHVLPEGIATAVHHRLAPHSSHRGFGRLPDAPHHRSSSAPPFDAEKRRRR